MNTPQNGDSVIPRVAFDYQSLDAEIRQLVKDKTAEIHSLVRMTEHNVVKIGQKLAIVRDQLNGQFRNWVESKFA